MKIAITGATGMIGSKLAEVFLSQSHTLVVLTRENTYERPEASVIVWDPLLNYIDLAAIDGFDVVIHLAGASIASRWTPAYKDLIKDSRVQSTKLLCEELARLGRKPKLLLSASAVGYYGNHAPDEELDEKSPSGGNFLAEVCRKWEAATAQAQTAGIRVVHLRFGMVLGARGALGQMRRAFQWGLGGMLGDGRQIISWIALDEIPSIVEHIIGHENISGAVNAVSPHPVSNADFTKTLAQVMHKPAVLPLPAFAVSMLFGEMGQTLLLEGARVLPRSLNESGYQFKLPELKEALDAALV